jgi:hypothetical protein
MTRYEHGFMNKCAEYGVPADAALALLKTAARRDDSSLGAAAGALTGVVAGGGGGGLAGALSSEKPFVEYLRDSSLHGVEDKELRKMLEDGIRGKTYKDLLEQATREGSEYQFKKMHNIFRTARAGKLGAVGAAGGLTLGAILGQLLSKKGKGKSKKRTFGFKLG